MPRLLAAVLFAATARLGAQTFDFEDGIPRGWTQTGKAFGGQPYCRSSGKEMPSARFAATKVGGDYWQGLEYPLGQHGNCLLASALKAPGPEPRFGDHACEGYKLFRNGKEERKRENPAATGTLLQRIRRCSIAGSPRPGIGTTRKRACSSPIAWTIASTISIPMASRTTGWCRTCYRT